jgi:hypothetical protein
MEDGVRVGMGVVAGATQMRYSARDGLGGRGVGMVNVQAGDSGRAPLSHCMESPNTVPRSAMSRNFSSTNHPHFDWLRCSRH